MVYLHVGSSDLFLILVCMTSNFSYLSFSTLHSSSWLRTETNIFAKLNKPLKCVWKKNKPPLGDFKEDLQYLKYNKLTLKNLLFFTVLGGSEWGGPLVGFRLKFSYFVGSRLKFSIFVGSRLNFLIFVGCWKISVNK